MMHRDNHFIRSTSKCLSMTWLVPTALDGHCPNGSSYNGIHVWFLNKMWVGDNDCYCWQAIGCGATVSDGGLTRQRRFIAMLAGMSGPIRTIPVLCNVSELTKIHDCIVSSGDEWCQERNMCQVTIGLWNDRHHALKSNKHQTLSAIFIYLINSFK